MTHRLVVTALTVALLTAPFAEALVQSAVMPDTTTTQRPIDDKTGDAVRAPIAFLNLDGAKPNSALPDGWRTRAVRGQRAPSSRVVDSAGVKFLRIEGTDAAGWFVRAVDPRLRPAPGVLTWQWRFPAYPELADMRAPGTDDSALRVFVAFGPIRAIGRAPRTIFYSIGGPEPDAHASFGHSSRDVFVVRVGSGAAARDWTAVRMDPFADYRRAWGSEPPSIAVIGVLQDTEQTRGRAVADLRSLSWNPADARSP